MSMDFARYIFKCDCGHYSSVRNDGARNSIMNEHYECFRHGGHMKQQLDYADLIDTTRGRLTVKDVVFTENSGMPYTKVVAQCSCGDKVEWPISVWNNENRIACNEACQKYQNKFEELKNTKQSRLTVNKIYKQVQKTNVEWVADCECDCGNKCTPNFREILRGKTTSCGCFSREQKASWTKDKNANWRDGATTANQLARSILANTTWHADVKDRFDSKCAVTGCKCNESDLEMHHIYNFSSYELMRAKKVNGVSLCKAHHTEFHKEQGYHYNNLFQVVEFLSNKGSDYLDKVMDLELVKLAAQNHKELRVNRTKADNESKFYEEGISAIKALFELGEYDAVFDEMFEINLIPDTFKEAERSIEIEGKTGIISMICTRLGFKWTIDLNTKEETCTVVHRQSTGPAFKLKIS